MIKVIALLFALETSLPKAEPIYLHCRIISPTRYATDIKLDGDKILFFNDRFKSYVVEFYSDPCHIDRRSISCVQDVLGVRATLSISRVDGSFFETASSGGQRTHREGSCQKAKDLESGATGAIF